MCQSIFSVLKKNSEKRKSIPRKTPSSNGRFRHHECLYARGIFYACACTWFQKSEQLSRAQRALAVAVAQRKPSVACPCPDASTRCQVIGLTLSSHPADARVFIFRRPNLFVHVCVPLRFKNVCANQQDGPLCLRAANWCNLSLLLAIAIKFSRNQQKLLFSLNT